jgi:hypothetical protein
VLSKDNLKRRVCLLVLGGACACLSACLVTFDDWPLSGAGSGGQRGLGGGNLGGASGGSSGAGGRADMGGSSGGTASGGAPSGGAPSGGNGTGGNGGAAALVSGANWLTFKGDWADPADAPNGALNVSGSVYAYGDGCATLSWDKATRCASGVLCSPGPTYQNWGVAIGFDFRNTGDSGSPPNAKLTWNPEDVGAIGVAWNITGTAPGLQLWVLNMDPSWAGVCTAATCDIPGPPDGMSSASANGALYFSGMQKDTWNSGVAYTYSPAATDSLQFKLAAIRAGAASFAFCLDRLGIILP